MSEPWTWTEADLRQMVTDGVEESLSLDYKAAAALGKSEGRKNEISKDVSAFANSIGGVIVYGMSEVEHLPAGVDPVDPAEFSREWLEQVINSRVQPRIAGLRVNPVRLSDGNVAYVVQIPQSQSAPHQAGDRRYYKRYNFESLPMDDFEVRDVARRVSGPRLRLSIRGGPKSRFLNAGTLSITASATVYNDSHVTATDMHIRLWFDERLTAESERFSPVGPSFITFGERQLPVNGFSINRSSVLDYAIWQGLGRTVGTIEVSAPRAPGIDYWLAWQIYAPQMSTKFGLARLRVTPAGNHIEIHDLDLSNENTVSGLGVQFTVATTEST